MDPQSNAYQRAIGVLQRLGNPELLDTYTRYAARLEATLGAARLETYAELYQRDRRQLASNEDGPLRVPEENALRERALADPEINALSERFVALLKRDGLIDQRYVD